MMIIFIIIIIIIIKYYPRSIYFYSWLVTSATSYIFNLQSSSSIFIFIFNLHHYRKCLEIQHPRMTVIEFTR